MKHLRPPAAARPQCPPGDPPCAGPQQAQGDAIAPSATPSQVRSLLDDFVRRGGAPGLQYVAVDGRGLMHAEAVGLAAVAGSRPMRADTAQLAYSMSKTLTAAAVMKLAEQGLIGIDAPVTRFLPWQPYGTAITVRHLLTHTGGLPNPLPLRWVHPAARHAGFDARAALRRAVAAHPHPSSPPGMRFAYSNLGYWLLGEVVEQATGQAFTCYLRDQILAPLGIEPALLGFEAADEGAQARGHLERWSLLGALAPWLVDPALLGPRTGRWLTIRAHYPDGAAFGGLVGCATGFAPWLQDLLRDEPRLWHRETRDLFMAPQHDARGRPLPMTLGWHLEDGAAGRVLFKEGGGCGFHGLMRVYPGAGFASIVMTNATSSPVRRLLDRVDRLVIDGARH